MKYSRMIPLLVTSFLVAACGGKSDQPNIELVQGMMVSPAYKAQDYDPNRKGSSMRLPPENTLAIGKTRYPYGPGELDKAAAELVNPYKSQVTPGVLARGKDRYEIYCGVCHGMQGGGDGPVAAKMPIRPPSLINDLSKGYRDGYFYHVIYQGKGVMGNYASQITDTKDRWAVVSYIRSLQKLSAASGN